MVVRGSLLIGSHPSSPVQCVPSVSRPTSEMETGAAESSSGFFLACKDFGGGVGDGGSANHACSFLQKWRSAHMHLLHSLGQGQSAVMQ